MIYSELKPEIRERLELPEEDFNHCPPSAQNVMIRYAEERFKQDRINAERIRIDHEVEIAVDSLRARGAQRRVGINQPEPPRQFNRHRETFDISSAFPDNESHPELYLDGRVLGFRPETVHAFEPRIREMVEHAIELQERDNHIHVQRSFMSYMMFHIWAGGQRRAGTPIVTVFDNEGIHERINILIEKLQKFIDDIREESAGYEYLYEGEATAHLHFYYCLVTFPQPHDHTRWGKVLPVETRPFFDIFTASDPKRDCVVQCAERIALMHPNLRHIIHYDTLDKLIVGLNKRLCILNFHVSNNSINDIRDYTDLILSKDSPCRNYNVIDSDNVYIIQHNGHIGLLENFKEQKRKRYYTTFRPLVKFPNCKKITVCFDIECYFDPHNDQHHIPYLACCCICYDDVPGNVVEFTENDCVASMIDYIADIAMQLDHNSVELIAHNGGGYDFHYILSSMPDPIVVKNILIRNNHFIGFKFKHRHIQFSVKDSLHFLSCSLSKAAKSFLEDADRKTDFPHHEILTQVDLQRGMQEWLKIDVVISSNVEKERMLITSKHVIQYKERGQSKKLMEWAIQYCRNDVIVLAKVWIAFKRTVHTIFGFNIVDNTYTLAGMSFRLLEAFMPPEMLVHPYKDDFINMRSALVGGRCISMNGLYHDIACLDVKSLYPAAMSEYPQPYGPYRKVKTRSNGELGIYKVRVTTNSTNESGFFPIRYQDVTYSSKISQTYDAWYTSVDIDIAIEEGHTIEYLTFEDGYIGYSWKQKGPIFKDYVENTLYKLKLMYEQQRDHEKRTVIKLIMNSLWGKFAQKWMDTQYKILNEEDVLDDMEAYKIWDTHHILVKSTRDKYIADKPVQNGVFVLSWARWHMKKLWKECVKSGTKCLYSDTDSVFVPYSSILHESPFIGNDMGQLELECRFETFVCVGKKQYIGSYYENGVTKYKKRFKGVPQMYIRPDLFMHLLQHPDNKAQIDFLKFKREWGVIRGYIESKLVTQT
ncbi:hypothetical protein INT43_004458 [Umbelopsis isabellina]|uniref:DNA polymerase n=1 Tax=Mortierella isabellina TaxID=91625 RepID=A0A8H7PCD4_MORIS|nr:hypothetical protein INT43_004458 [Umbelopsis isabellina]